MAGETTIDPAKGTTGAGDGGKSGTAVAEPAKTEKADAGAAAAKGTESTSTSTAKAIELKVPEGSHLAPERVTEILAEAKEKGYTQEQAQAALEREHRAVKTHVEAQQAALTETMKGWEAEIKSDQELGGDSFAQNVELAKRVVQKYATESFRKTLSETGFGNHPELVRVFVRIGKAMSDDSWAKGGNPAPKKSLEEVFYPSSEKKES